MVKFFYIRDKKRNPIGCVAFEVSRRSNSDEKHIVFAMSFHNPEDQWQRSTARQIAQERLSSPEDSYSSLTSFQGTNWEFFKQTLKQQLNGEKIKMPPRARHNLQRQIAHMLRT